MKLSGQVRKMNVEFGDLSKEINRIVNGAQFNGVSVLRETATDSLLNLNVVSHWADFEKKSGRKTNSTSQQRFFSGDLGMAFSSETVLDIKWGRT